VAEARPRPRILNLSDLVFGLALSIGALSLVGQQATTTSQFFTSLGLYALSFFILLSVWRSYSLTTSTMPTETAMTTRLHYILLFLVAIEPYLFGELFTGTGSLPSNVSEVYALDIGSMFLILAVFNHLLSKEQEKVAPTDLLHRYRRTRNSNMLVGAIFVVSAVPLLDTVILFSFVIRGLTQDFTLRTTLWLVGMVLGLSARLFSAQKKN
jgi:uncharacterized membrane protein